MTLATAIVDTHALLQLVYVALAVGVGVCVVYAVAVVGLTRSGEHRRADRRWTAFMHGALAAIAIAACGWAIVTGVTIMTQK